MSEPTKEDAKLKTIETILKQLIGFDTTSYLSNLALLDWVSNYLRAHGLVPILDYNAEKNKANLMISFPAQTQQGGVILSGHTDTVPVTGQNWSKPSHELSQTNDRYYGRGTADMKSFLAVMLAYVPELIAQPLAKPLHFLFSYDEEIGCVGIRTLLDKLQQDHFKAQYCIIGEPTSMKVANQHKGKLAMRVDCKGLAYHSGLAPKGVNAVFYAAKLITFLASLAEHKKQYGPFETVYEIPYSTVHVGQVAGGVALNIVPEDCYFLYEIRYVTAEDINALQQSIEDYANRLAVEMQQASSTATIQFSSLANYPALNTSMDSQTQQFMQLITGETDVCALDFGSEGGLISQALGIKTVVCGPGSMEQGHKADEYITKTQLQHCSKMMIQLINLLSI